MTAVEPMLTTKPHEAAVLDRFDGAGDLDETPRGLLRIGVRAVSGVFAHAGWGPSYPSVMAMSQTDLPCLNFIASVYSGER